jgi:hypothetical protein
MVAFDNKVGVMWSDQTGSGAQQRDNLGFRVHDDNNPDPSPAGWGPTEILPIPP